MSEFVSFDTNGKAKPPQAVGKVVRDAGPASGAAERVTGGVKNDLAHRSRRVGRITVVAGMAVWLTREAGGTSGSLCKPVRFSRPGGTG